MMFGKKLFRNPLREENAYSRRGEVILRQAKKNKSVIYGARALQKHISPYARKTQDYDIFSRKPKRSARRLERKLDKASGGDFYYQKLAEHPGTVKIRHVGRDNVRGTEDDLDIADYTKMEKGLDTKKIDGVRYVTLPSIVKNRKEILKDKTSAYRHKKDRDDLSRIRYFKKQTKRSFRRR